MKITIKKLKKGVEYLVKTELGWFIGKWAYHGHPDYDKCFVATTEAEPYFPSYDECDIILDLDEVHESVINGSIRIDCE
jgi:hypothetical protein